MSNRSRGTVARVLGDYGFISCPDEEENLYFKTEWIRGNSSVVEGDEVEFKIKRYGDNVQAHYVDVTSSQSDSVDDVSAPRAPDLPINDELFDWAYLGHMPDILEELKQLALDERWDFKHVVSKSKWQYPILSSYLFNTFGRLVLEKKVMVGIDKNYAAFNTGLVDSRYEPIYALFERNSSGRQDWRLSSFCVAGEGRDGQNLVRYFHPLPETAHYFENATELLYDTSKGTPDFDWKHVIVERIGRYPKEFVEDHWPKSFEKKDTSDMSDEERKAYFCKLGAAIEEDPRVYRQIMNRVKDGINLALKRIQWNYKTAIPTYYPRVRRLQLLLPLCLLSDDQVDVALAVERTPTGSYLGHTILPLDWAYKNARLVCRPDSQWLAPEKITTTDEAEDE